MMNSKQYAPLLAQCITTKNLNFGKLLHSHFIKTSIIFDTFISNRLIELYAKCGSIKCAHKVFYDLPYKNVRSWNVLVTGYCRNGLFVHAHQLLDEMPEPSIVSYTAVVSGLAQHGLYKESLMFFKKMRSLCSGLLLNEFAIVNCLSSCAVLGAVKLLRQLHLIAVVFGLEFNAAVCNALIDAYGKCGYAELSYKVFCRMSERDVVSRGSMVAAFCRAARMDDARRVFDQMPVKNTVSWTTLISGFVQNGQGMEGLSLFGQMQAAGVQLNAVTYVAALGACADLALVEKGKQLHGRIIRSSNNKDCLLNLYTYNAMIDMYCKCGEMRSARMLFETMPEKDIVSWNSLVTGLAQKGHNRESITLLERMIAEGVKPNKVTFLGVLSACSHTGLLDESTRILDLMVKHGLKPASEHYAIIIDLLGRKNRLNEALELIERLPGGSNHIGMWGALLAACRVHGNTVLAKKAADMLFTLDPSNTARYVMLSNIYAAGNNWNNSREVRTVMGEKGLRKDPGFSWIEVKNTRHEFVAKDKSHSCQEDIYNIIHELRDQMSEVECSSRVEIDLEDELCDYVQVIS